MLTIPSRYQLTSDEVKFMSPQITKPAAPKAALSPMVLIRSIQLLITPLTSSATLTLADSLQLSCSLAALGRLQAQSYFRAFALLVPSASNAPLLDMHVAHSLTLLQSLLKCLLLSELPWLNYLKLQTPMPGIPSPIPLVIFSRTLINS